MTENEPPDPPEPPSAPGPSEPPLLDDLAIPEFQRVDTAGSSGDRLTDLGPWADLLRNRLILSGIGLVAVLGLVAVILLAFGSGDGDVGGPVLASNDSEAEATAPVTVDARDGMFGVLRSTATIHNGPNGTYSILGTVPRNARVPVVGRNADDTWLQITYPPGSDLHGWVDATLIDVTGDIAGLEIAGPGAGPSIVVPTSSFVDGATPPEFEGPDATSELAPTRTVRPTRTPITFQPTRTRVPHTPGAPTATPPGPPANTPRPGE